MPNRLTGKITNRTEEKNMTTIEDIILIVASAISIAAGMALTILLIRNFMARETR